jgi:hypothetical protein
MARHRERNGSRAGFHAEIYRPVVHPTAEFARCFLHLANLPNYALDRLCRYEATLWRQVRQILFALDALDRRKPQDRGRRFRFDSRQGLPNYEPEELLTFGRPRGGPSSRYRINQTGSSNRFRTAFPAWGSFGFGKPG